MLSKLLFFISAVLFCFGSILAQETKKDLTEKAAALYKEGKFERAIEAAEKVVEMEKSAKPQDSASYVNALVNLARIRNGYVIELQKEIRDDDAFASEKIETARKISENAAEMEKLYRAAIETNAKNGKAQSAQTADLKMELAFLVQKYNPAARSVESSRGRIDEAEKLLLESLSINEQVHGKDAARTLSSVFDLGNFYLKYVNFEKALPFYERYLQASENARGKNDAEMVEALGAYASILSAAYQEKEAAAALKKFEEITRRKEAAKLKDFNFHLRSKDAVAYSSTVSQSFQGKNESFRKKLQLQGKTLNRSSAFLMPKIVRVEVKVVVDEKGKVVEAVADAKDEKLRARAEQEIAKWTVRPFSYNNATRKMRGFLIYTEIQ